MNKKAFATFFFGVRLIPCEANLNSPLYKNIKKNKIKSPNPSLFDEYQILHFGNFKYEVCESCMKIEPHQLIVPIEATQKLKDYITKHNLVVEDEIGWHLLSSHMES